MVKKAVALCLVCEERPHDEGFELHDRGRIIPTCEACWSHRFRSARAPRHVAYRAAWVGSEATVNHRKKSRRK